MGFSFGGHIVEHRAPVKAPRTLRALYEEYPELDDEPQPDPDASLDFLELAYDGKVHRTDEMVGLEVASSREGDRPYVTFDQRCVVVFDRWGALSCDFEQEEPPSTFEARLAAYTLRRDIQRLMVFTLDSVSDSYGFIVFEGGKRVRRFSFIPAPEEPIRIDEGARLATEPEEEAHPHDRIDQAAKSLLGRRLIELAGDESLRAFVCDKR